MFPIRGTPRALALLGLLILAIVALIATAPEPDQVANESVAPELATGFEIRPATGPAKRHMAVAANPLAVQAALAILRAGGGAVDAAIAAQMVLNVVEPQSSGIGGGGFMLHYDAGTQQVVAYDGRETAPAAATPDLFLDATGEPMGFYEAVVGGRAVGAPGLLRMLEQAHRDNGLLPWRDLFQPAIKLAREGFQVSARLAKLIAADKYLGRYPATRRLFFPDGEALAEGDVLRNPDLANALYLVAEGGADAFYRGPIAADIVNAVLAASDNPGRLSQYDLAGYRSVARDPVCMPYRIWVVCGMPPPSSGGTTVLAILGLLERFDLVDVQRNAADLVHLFAEASRLAFADRNKYVADPDRVKIPWGLLDRVYLADRSQSISPFGRQPIVRAGLPPGAREDDPPPPETGVEGQSTSHLSIVDDYGNAVSMTTSIESAFGSRMLVRGFLLNNQLTDFSFRPEVDGAPVANRVEPGKRPRSSMAPTLVFDAPPEDGGKLVLAVGSPGGARIIDYVAQVLIQTLDLGVAIDAAVAEPHFTSLGGPIELEEGTALGALGPTLEALGNEVKVRALNSGLHAIAVTEEGLVGGADPRREGIALGD